MLLILSKPSIRFVKKKENIRILYEDNHLIAADKPAGWLVQGDETGDLPLVEWVREYIRRRYNKPGNVFCGLIHRIDRPVSGVVLMARTGKALSRMSEMFRSRAVKKTYWALVEKRPPLDSGELEHYLLKDAEKNLTKAFDQPSRRSEGAKPARLTYRIAGRVSSFYMLEVHPETGRSHQIRAQLSKAGFPILADVKYGGRAMKEADGRIYLHARALEFEHPVKKETIQITCDLPHEQIWDLFKTLE